MMHRISTLQAKRARFTFCVHKKCQKWPIWKPEACSQIVLSDRSYLIGLKFLKIAKNEKFKYDISGDFKTLCTLFDILKLCPKTHFFFKKILLILDSFEFSGKNEYFQILKMVLNSERKVEKTGRNRQEQNYQKSYFRTPLSIGSATHYLVSLIIWLSEEKRNYVLK